MARKRLHIQYIDKTPRADLKVNVKSGDKSHSSYSSSQMCLVCRLCQTSTGDLRQSHPTLGMRLCGITKCSSSMIVLVAQVIFNTFCRGAFYLINLVANMPVNIRDVVACHILTAVFWYPGNITQGCRRRCLFFVKPYNFCHLDYIEQPRFSAEPFYVNIY